MTAQNVFSSMNIQSSQNEMGPETAVITNELSFSNICCVTGYLTEEILSGYEPSQVAEW